MDNVPSDVLDRIQKLLNLASKNTQEGEAASAAAKAQELLERYNLSSDAVDGRQVGSGAREKTAVDGGFYRFQRSMWGHVAQLNFCLYWTGEKWIDKEYRPGRRFAPGQYGRAVKQHNLVGRRVNVATTKAMAGYLLNVVDRLTRDRLHGNGEALYSNWANSYRSGITARICQKLRQRRSEVLAAEEERKAAEQRTADGTSTATALGLQVYIDRETDANYDFLYGEGWSAKRAADAAKARAEREAYTRWAAEHPEEAAAEEAKRRKGRRDRGGRSSSGNSNIDRGAYWSGYDDAADVSIDPQVDDTKVGGLL